MTDPMNSSNPPVVKSPSWHPAAKPRGKIPDITSQLFGRLIVLRFAGVKQGRGYWLCKCDCGSEKVILGSSLKRGGSKSCGCLQKELVSARRTACSRPLVERLWKNIDIRGADECWPWLASCRQGGCGKIKNNKMKFAHRTVYEQARDIELPLDIIVRHTCENRDCCNPNHLLIGTHQDNSDDKITRGRQVSLKGSQHGMAKLTEQQVKAILGDRRPQRVIADAYGVHWQHINKIKRRKAWRHLHG